MAAYPATTRALHWATVVALGARFAVGYLMDDDEAAGVLGLGDGGGGGLMTVHVVLGPPTSGWC